MPPAYRLADFDVGMLKSPHTVLALLATVRPRPQSVLPMSRPPADYVAKLKESSNADARQKAGAKTEPRSAEPSLICVDPLQKVFRDATDLPAAETPPTWRSASLRRSNSSSARRRPFPI